MKIRISFLLLLIWITLLTGCNQASLPDVQYVGSSQNWKATLEATSAKSKQSQLTLRYIGDPAYAVGAVRFTLNGKTNSTTVTSDNSASPKPPGTYHEVSNIDFSHNYDPSEPLSMSVEWSDGKQDMEEQLQLQPQ